MVKLNKTTIFFDIDGVLYSSGKILPNAVEVFNAIQDKFDIVMLSNSVRKTKQEYYKQFVSDGFNVKPEQFHSVLDATNEFLSKDAKGKKVCYFCMEKTKKEFEKKGFVFVGLKDCDMVLLGFYPEMTWNDINEVFKVVLSGAQLVLLQGDIWGMTENGKVLGPASIAKMIDNVVGCGFDIIGKPSKQFFENALKKYNVKPNQSIMVGDNYATDIIGAQTVGMKTIFIKSNVPQPFFQKLPDVVVENMVEVKQAIDKLFIN